MSDSRTSDERSRLGVTLSILPSIALAATLSLAARSEAQVSGGWFNTLAFGSVVGGQDADGSPFYVCRSNDPQTPNNHPGETKFGWNGCNYGWGHQQRFASQYQALSPSWVPGNARGGSPFGYEGTTTLSVCRGPIPGVSGLHVGKHIAGINGCVLPYGNVEVWISSYELLNEANFGIETTQGHSLYSLVGGYEADGTVLYPCLGTIPGIPGVHPGKTRKDWNVCRFGYANAERHATDFKTFVPIWRWTNLETASFPILSAGSEANGASLGVCRIWIGTGLHVGKLLPNGWCHVGTGNTEQTFSPSPGFQTLRRRGPTI